MKTTIMYLRVVLTVILVVIALVTGIIAVLSLITGIFGMLLENNTRYLLILPFGLVAGFLTAVALDCLKYFFDRWGWS